MSSRAHLFRERGPTSVELPGGFHRALTALARNRHRYLKFFIGAVMLATIVTLMWRPTYEVTATVSLKPDQVSVSGRDDRSGRLRPEQLARPQMVLLESESVLRKAIDTVGADRLFPKLAAKLAEGEKEPAVDTTRFGHIVRRLVRPMAPKDEAYMGVANSVYVRAEPQTEMIRIAFRHKEPNVAVDFTNAWLQAFTERYFQIYSSGETLTMLRDQQKRATDTYERTSGALARFSAESQIYQIGDQRKLLLERRNNVATAMTTTRGQIAEKQSQADAIPHQLAQMKPINSVQQVIALTRDQLQDAAASGRARPDVQTTQGKEPPILLIKVYQETIANLVRLQTELAGLKSLVNQQQQAVVAIDTDLTTLSRRESEFERRQQEVNQARQNAELYLKRANEEEFFQEMNARKLSSVQVLQAPMVPVSPVWPKPLVVIPLALFACLAAAALSHSLGMYATPQMMPHPQAEPRGGVRLNPPDNAALPPPVKVAAE